MGNKLGRSRNKCRHNGIFFLLNLVEICPCHLAAWLIYFPEIYIFGLWPHYYFMEMSCHWYWANIPNISYFRFQTYFLIFRY
jgi:hypothetical protein